MKITGNIKEISEQLEFLSTQFKELPSDFRNTIKDSLSKIKSDQDKEILTSLINDFENTNAPKLKVIGRQEIDYLNNSDPSIWAPYLIHRWKFKVFPKEKIVAEFPVYILIEPVSSCNFRCPMCFQIDNSFTRKPFMGTMDFDFFCSIIDQAQQGGTGAITLASRGEPTLHPRLGEMLQYASNKFFDLKINTNASKLTETLAHQILRSGVNNLVFSVDWHEKEIFEKLRKGGIFEEVLENITQFHRIRDAFYPNSKVITRVSGVSVLKEQDDTEEYNNFWSKIVDQVAMMPCDERWDTYANEIKPELILPCQILWDRFYVWFDGVCNPCDIDYKSMLTVGKLSPDTSIKDVWTGKSYQKLRQEHLLGKRNETTPCDRCGIS